MDDDFIRQLAQNDAAEQNRTKQDQELQLHRAEVLKAKLPSLFQAIFEAVQTKARQYDDIVRAEKGESTTTLSGNAGHNFTVEHKRPGRVSKVNVFAIGDPKLSRMVVNVGRRTTL